MMGFEIAIPEVAFGRFQRKLMPHANIHFFFHNTVCRLLLNYKRIPYIHFIRVKKDENGNGGGLTTRGTA